jgi:NodT family efflux transporter outer membrane factor (OMF) lipoprotein
MTRARIIAAMAAPLMLAACNLAPAYRPPVVTPPAAYKPVPGWQQAAPADLDPRGNWWSLFDDPVLDGLEKRLDDANPDLAAALARHDAALAYAGQARGALLPSLGLQGTATQNRQSEQRPLRGLAQPDNYGADQINGVLGYEVDLWGRLHNQLHARQALAQASDADRAAIQLSLEAQLASDYLTLRGLDDQIRLLDDTTNAYARTHALTRTLFNGKLAAQMDVSRAQVQLDNARTAAAQARADRAVLEDAVAVLVGDMPSTFRLEPAAAPHVPDVPVGLPATLLERRPDVASAERAVAAANLGIGIARAAFYPSLTLGALGGVASSGENPFNAGDLFWALGPSISLPLFEGGKLKAGLVQAQATFREASAHYRATALAAFQQVEDNRAQIARLAQEAVSAQDAVAAARQTAEASLSLYTNGATSYLDVVTAQTALLQAEQAALDIRTRRLATSVALVRALGGGWHASPALTASTSGPARSVKGSS